MLRHARHITLLLLLLSSMVAGAQNRNNLIATKNSLVLLVDLNSPKGQIDTILMRAGIRGANIQAFIKGDFSKLLNDGWALTTRKYNIVEFSRKLKELNANPQESPFIITSDIFKGNKGPGYMDNAIYGINKFSTVSVYELPSGLTRFILPGHLQSRRVFLSGGFNEWSTLKGLMNKTSTGWAIDIKLKPGAWMYKFIADDGWMTDPNNLINIDDGAGNTNSVYYKYNYTLKLHGNANAKKIALAGDFNGWKNNELFFERQGDVWERSLYLKEGMHTYLYYVDGNAINDPANSQKYKDADGRLCSVLNMGEATTFKLGGHTDAHEVYLAGTFTKWQDGKIKMKKVDGGWALSLVLQPGNYDYKFIIDGDWITDPANPTHDVEGGVLNSFVAVKPNHTFRLKGHEDSKTVIVSGSFNNWDENGYRMGKTDDGWMISVCLKPGKTLYKFSVDDKWILDPANKLWEQGGHNTGNSVLWIEP